MLGEVLPPAHIQQVAGELVKALQLIMGEAGGRERDGFLRVWVQSSEQAGASADGAESTVITFSVVSF